MVSKAADAHQKFFKLLHAADGHRRGPQALDKGDPCMMQSELARSAALDLGQNDVRDASAAPRLTSPAWKRTSRRRI